MAAPRGLLSGGALGAGVPGNEFRPSSCLGKKTTAMRLRGLSRLILRVSRLSASEAFYRDVLGLPVLRRIGQDGVVFAVGDDELVLRQAETPLEPGVRDSRMGHMGFEIGDPAELDSWVARFRFHGVPILLGPVWRDPGSRSLFVQDPDGNRIELYASLQEPELQGDIQVRG
jgi:catechol 2,3-dioxygenase-like lactoylglutathione lyase family enzyme